MSNIPRPEYPRPSFVRPDWINLNGEWSFEIDYSDTGLERGLLDSELKDKINVPFCPESPLSGIGNEDFMEAVWYRRQVEIPQNWNGRDVLLHFQAVDYETTVWVNGMEVGRHRGGFTGFECNLGPAAELGGSALIVVRARDPRVWHKAAGKQSPFMYNKGGCRYTRTTGIWQTVWMEPVPHTALNRPKITPDLDKASFRLDQALRNPKAGLTVKAVVKDAQGIVTSASAVTGKNFATSLTLEIPKDKVRLWQPGDGQLYDIEITLEDANGNIIDKASTYAGLRSVAIDDRKILINGKSVFQRLVLDQGYYRDGIMTAPSDEALKNDIILSMQAGFNGARLHQKVFEERFLYYADQLGYMVWGEYGDWGYRHDNCVIQRYIDDSQRHQPGAAIMRQWTEVLARDYSHPAIIGWCPLNETSEPIEDYQEALDDVTNGMFLMTKNMDSTRPVLDASGYSHRVVNADLYDCHDYEQNVEKFAEHYVGLPQNKPYYNDFEVNPVNMNISYKGQPYFVSEFGGTWWNPAQANSDASWGYGERPKTVEEVLARFKGLCDTLLDNPNMFGYCYTQLTDVFQEQNGVLYFDRQPKFEMATLHAIQTRKAAIED